MISNQKLVSFLLRLSIAAVFLYAAVAATIEPDNWIGYLPQTLRNILPARQLLLAFSVYEFSLSLWLLSGKKTFFAALLAAATLCGIIVSNIGAIDIVFRDIAILIAACALAVGNFSHSS